MCSHVHFCLCVPVCAATQCTICFAHDSDTQLQPCGHVMCEACFQQVRKSAIYLTQSGVSCPFCRCIVKSSAPTILGKPPHSPPTSTSIWPPGDQGHGQFQQKQASQQEQEALHKQQQQVLQHELQQDPLDFSDMSHGEHQWFCDVAAQVARAELEAARMAGQPKGLSDGPFESRAPFALHAQGHDSQQYPTHVQQQQEQEHQHHHAHMQPHVHVQGYGSHVGMGGGAFFLQQQQQQQQRQMQQQVFAAANESRAPFALHAQGHDSQHHPTHVQQLQHQHHHAHMQPHVHVQGYSNHVGMGGGPFSCSSSSSITSMAVSSDMMEAPMGQSMRNQ